MRKLVQFLFNVALLAALAWGAWWAWQAFSGGGRSAAASGQVLDIDKQCRVAADTGQCLCRHARTGERLQVPYDECVALSRKR